MNTYAIYKGDEFIDLGTIKELSKKHNISEKHYIIILCLHIRKEVITIKIIE